MFYKNVCIYLITVSSVCNEKLSVTVFISWKSPKLCVIYTFFGEVELTGIKIVVNLIMHAWVWEGVCAYGDNQPAIWWKGLVRHLFTKPLTHTIIPMQEQHALCNIIGTSQWSMLQTFPPLPLWQCFKNVILWPQVCHAFCMIEILF